MHTCFTDFWNYYWYWKWKSNQHLVWNIHIHTFSSLSIFGYASTPMYKLLPHLSSHFTLTKWKPNGSWNMLHIQPVSYLQYKSVTKQYIYIRIPVPCGLVFGAFQVSSISRAEWKLSSTIYTFLFSMFEYYSAPSLHYEM